MYVCVYTCVHVYNYTGIFFPSFFYYWLSFINGYLLLLVIFYYWLSFIIFSSTGLESIPEGACTFVKVFALKPGHTKLTVLYDHGSIHLETSITIASYPSLRPVDPETIAVVTLGSSKTVVFEGGPSAWVLDPSQYDRTCKNVYIHVHVIMHVLCIGVFPM